MESVAGADELHLDSIMTIRGQRLGGVKNAGRDVRSLCVSGPGQQRDDTKVYEMAEMQRCGENDQIRFAKLASSGVWKSD